MKFTKPRNPFAFVDWTQVRYLVQDRATAVWAAATGSEEPQHIIINVPIEALERALANHDGEARYVRLHLPNNVRIPPALWLGVAFITGAILG